MLVFRLCAAVLAMSLAACTEPGEGAGGGPEQPQESENENPCAPLHDGGDGSCVDIGTCAAEYVLDEEGRCGRWRKVQDLPFKSIAGSAVRLLDGRVLVTGGDARTFSNSAEQTRRAAIFDPATEEWHEIEEMGFARMHHDAVVMPDGRVFVMCGKGAGIFPAEVEVFDPASETWSSAPSMPFRNYCHGFLDRNGQLHLVSGFEVDYVLDEERGAWVPASAPAEPRVLGALHPLPDGGAVYVGGQGERTPDNYIFSDKAVRFDPVSESWTEIASDPLLIRDLFGSALLSDGRVLAIGGQTAQSFINSAVFVDTITGAIDAAIPFPLASSGISVVAHEDGAIAFGAADANGTPSDQVLLYRDDDVLELPSLQEPGNYMYAIVLEDGRILRTGGQSAFRQGSVVTSIFERGR